jgi:folate-dependent phosphoribosylglycinamide formyltransferase PurN
MKKTTKNNKEKIKIVMLLGSSLANLNTLSTILDGGNNVVGAIVVNQNTNGVNIKYLKNMIKKSCFFKVLLQILERILYKLIFSNRDRRLYSKIFDEKKINSIIDKWKGDIIYDTRYDSERCVAWIKSKNPDLIIIHTKYWVSKKVRDLVNGNIIGGHPGLTQKYRGVHSPFWAIYNNDFENIGYTGFFVDSGVDSGDIIFQGKIKFNNDDTYMSISWKGMIAIAKKFNQLLNNISSINDIKSIKNNFVMNKTIYYHPTIFEFFYFLRIRYLTKKNK